MALARRWHVLLIGGPSGSGKTTLAAGLGRLFDVSVAQLDDVQVALETATSAAQQPDLHFWKTNWDDFSSFTDAQHLEHFLALSRGLFSPVIRAIVADRLDGGLPCIIEGDFVLPELAADLAADHGEVRALFLYEDDESQLAGNILARQTGDPTLRAHTSSAKSRWLRDECVRWGLPSLAARPWASGTDRAVRLLAT